MRFVNKKRFESSKEELCFHVFLLKLSYVLVQKYPWFVLQKMIRRKKVPNLKRKKNFLWKWQILWEKAHIFGVDVWSLKKQSICALLFPTFEKQIFFKESIILSWGWIALILKVTCIKIVLPLPLKILLSYTSWWSLSFSSGRSKSLVTEILIFSSSDLNLVVYVKSLFIKKFLY